MNTQDIELDMAALPWRGTYPKTCPQDMDLLATIFEGQRLLHERYYAIEKANGCVVVAPENFGDLDSREVQMRLKDLMERTIEELMEAANCLKNKPWKNSFVHTDREHFYEELADAVHFFVELMETAGWTAEDMFTWYFRKHAVNRFRQDSNY